MEPPTISEMPGGPRITVFSDFTDPASYVTEAGVRVLAAELGLAVEHHAVEAYPGATPLPSPEAYAERVDAVAGSARAEGLPLRHPDFVPRTRKAHEAAMLAAELGLGEAMRRAIYEAYWAEGRDIGRIDVLVDIGSGLGMDPADIKIALDIDRFDDALARDRDIARRLGIRGVPVVYVGIGRDAQILAGLQTRAALDAAIRAR